MRRWCEGGGIVLTRMLRCGEKVSPLPLTRRLDYRLPKGGEQVVGKLEGGGAKCFWSRLRRNTQRAPREFGCRYNGYGR